MSVPWWAPEPDRPQTPLDFRSPARDKGISGPSAGIHGHFELNQLTSGAGTWFSRRGRRPRWPEIKKAASMTSIRILACESAVPAFSARAAADSYRPAPAWQTSELVSLTAAGTSGIFSGKRHFMNEPARHLLESST